MSNKTRIEWTRGPDGSPGATWNPLRGVKGNWHCTHVSEGCRNCYAERLNVRLGGPAYKPSADAFRLDEKMLTDPLRWKRPRMIFVCSMTDLFHEKVSVEWLDRIFSVIWLSQWHTHQILTKRIERARDYLASLTFERCRKWMNLSADGGEHRPGAYSLTSIGHDKVPHQLPTELPLPNVWLGVSAEDQKTADERIPLLMQTPAAVRWLSAEPLLDRISIAHFLQKFGHGKNDGCENRLDWVVLGGESGPHARAMSPNWARSLRDQCQAAGVPFFFKQWGEWAPSNSFSDLHSNQDTQRFRHDFQMARVGKKNAGRLLDGREWNEYPK